MWVVLTCALVQIPLWKGLVQTFGEPFGPNWFLPTAMPIEAQYHYSPDDDPDAFDPRDPLVKEHRRLVQSRLQAGQAVPHAGQYVGGGRQSNSCHLVL